MPVDILAIGTHPDDVEMTVGGTLAKLIDHGRSVAIMDLTRGEMGTHGTPETRAAEAAEAAKVLGVAERFNLDLGDGVLENTLENRVRVVEEVRRLRPTLVMAPYWEDLHPDHVACSQIVKGVMYPCGFANFPAKGERHRPREFLFYMSHFTFDPSFVIDVTGYMETKEKSILCYASQFHGSKGDDQKSTWIGQPGFIDKLRARAMHFGSLIHKDFGEPFISARPVPMDDPVSHYEPFFEV